MSFNKQEPTRPQKIIFKLNIVLETKQLQPKNKKRTVSAKSDFCYTMQKTPRRKCERLCYTGQKCQRIPETLVKMYGPRVHSLDMSYNELINLKGLEGFTELRELVLDNNQLSDSLSLPCLLHLHTLSLNKNKIVDLESLLIQISENLPNLTFLSLIGNKACPNELSGCDNDEEDYQRYRYFVLYHLPHLKFLDSNKVREDERIEGRRRGKFMNIIRPKYPSNVNEEPLNQAFSSKYTPLPKTIRSLTDHKGAYGKCRYRYSGKHSEGNRFISNDDL